MGEWRCSSAHSETWVLVRELQLQVPIMFPRGRNLLYWLARRLGGSQCRSGRFGESKYLQGSNHDFIYIPLSSSVTTIKCDNIVFLFRGLHIWNVVTLGLNDHHLDGDVCGFLQSPSGHRNKTEIDHDRHLINPYLLNKIVYDWR